MRQRGVTKESKLVHVTSSNVVELSGTARPFFVHSKFDTSQHGRRKERMVWKKRERTLWSSTTDEVVP